MILQKDDASPLALNLIILAAGTFTSGWLFPLFTEYLI
jgi:hypothetical protein